jgi:hypothetical protein
LQNGMFHVITNNKLFTKNLEQQLLLELTLKTRSKFID